MGCFWQCLTYTGVQTHNIHIDARNEDLAEADLLSTQDRIYSLTLLLPAFLPIY